MENPANSQAALAQLEQTQASAQNPNQILESQRQGMGVNAATDTVTGLRGAINNTTKLLKQVAPSVMGRTQNSLVTQAQATRQIGNESAPIAQNLTEQGQEYNDANQDLDRLEGRASTAANGIYTGQQDKLSYLQNLYNTLYGKEQDASKQAEATRQFDVEQARLRSSGSGGGGKFDLSNPTPTATNAAPTINDQAYTSVQKFLQGSDDQIKSDYAATLKSANYGNALDKLKVQLYQQSRPDLFGATSSASGGLSVSPTKTPNIANIVYGNKTTSNAPTKTSLVVR